MARFFAVCVLAVSILAMFPGPCFAQAPKADIKIDGKIRTDLLKGLKDITKTDDPKHPGFVEIEEDHFVPIEWTPVEARCPSCDSVAASYNETMRALMSTRYWIADIEAGLKSDQMWDNYIHSGSAGRNTGQGMTKADADRAANEMNYRMAQQEMKERLPELKEQLARLEALSKDLLAQLRECEMRMCTEGGGNFVRTTGTDAPASALPFDWRGPYPEVCHKCAKLAERLNALPGMAREVMGRLEKAKADKFFAELAIQEAQAFHTSMDDSKEQAAFNSKTQRTIKDAEKRKENAEREIGKAQKELDNLSRNFEETLRLYNDCVPTCKQGEGKKVGMALPSGDGQSQNCSFTSQDAFVIGPNSQYGTGAQLKGKAKDMATGAAMSAIGGLLGGGGISLGGGGGDDDVGSPGGGGSSGPKTVKDPTRGDFTHLKFSDIDLGVRAGFTNDGFVISQKIFDSPGDASTFHATWLEDGAGKKMLPGKYYIYSVYVDHKLTVWWTYDHWTDGQHDKHDEGSETQQWRTNLGDLAVRFNGEKGINNSIWYNSGYDTAAGGVQQMGALYPGITPESLAGTCGVNMVTHVTLPKQDPVSTIPVLSRLFIDPAASEGKKEKDLLIIVKPAIIDAAGGE